MVSAAVGVAASGWRVKGPAKRAQAKRGAKRGPKAAADPPAIWVAAALPGLEDLLQAEISRRFKGQVSFLGHAKASECHFRFAGRPKELLSLRLCHQLHRRRDFAVARPRTLLSPEHLLTLGRELKAVMRITPADRYVGLRFDAAGSNSPTLRRLGQQLSEQLGIPFENDTGDLVVTLRPGKGGWEVLCRVGSRPLGTRAYRQVNYRGSVSGTIAAALVELTTPVRGDRFLNLMCGSGMIMIEALERFAVGTVVGVDNSPTALTAAVRNCSAAGARERSLLMRADVRRLPFADGSFDKLCVDLPWGQSVGTRQSNISLYRDTFAESHRLCAADGKLVVLTLDEGAIKALGQDVARGWQLLEERHFVQRGFQPCCRVYGKRGEQG
jgi:23S rRNA G2445 N2-methylase RlmL